MLSTLPTLLTTLEMGDFQARWEAAKLLPSYGQRALPSLLALLQSDQEDWELRWFVARILADMASPEIVEGLLAVLHREANPEVAAAIAAALGNCGEAGVAALVPLLDHPDQRRLAVRTLTQMGHPATLEPLMALAQDNDETVRCQVLEALGAFRDGRVIPILLAALEDRSAAMRQEAVVALGKYLDSLSPETLEQALFPLLEDESLAVAEATATALGKAQANAAIARLGQVLQSPQRPESLRIAAAHALGWQGSALALATLTAAWPGASPGVQLAIITALERRGETQDSQPVSRIFQDWLGALLAHPQAAPQKQAIALALGHLQATDSIPLLQRLSLDPEESVQLHASAALRLLGAELIPTLQS